MRIAFATDDANGLDSVISYHFGRCPYYVFVDVENGKVKDVKSEGNQLLNGHDVGELPSLMKQRNVDVMVCGNMGPKAQSYFSDFGIKTILGAYGKVKDALNQIETNAEVPSKPIEHEEKKGADKTEVERLKEEVVDLRRQIADLADKISKLVHKV